MLEEHAGSLAFALVHGESLVACAAWALGAAEVHPVDLGTTWEDVVEVEVPFVLHDVLCPLTPPGFIAACVAEAVADDTVVVGVHPVTDTIRGADRDRLLSVASPLVLPASVVAVLRQAPGGALDGVLEQLARDHAVQPVWAPVAARRVGDEEDLRVLAALTAPT